MMGRVKNFHVESTSLTDCGVETGIFLRGNARGRFEGEKELPQPSRLLEGSGAPIGALESGRKLPITDNFAISAKEWRDLGICFWLGGLLGLSPMLTGHSTSTDIIRLSRTLTQMEVGFIFKQA